MSEKGDRIARLSSWLFVVVGFIVYESYGFIASLIFIGIAAIIRGDRDTELRNYLLSNSKYHIFLLGYYIVILLLVISVGVEYFYEMSGSLFVVLIGFPLLFILLKNDLSILFNQGKGGHR